MERLADLVEATSQREPGMSAGAKATAKTEKQVNVVLHLKEGKRQRRYIFIFCCTPHYKVIHFWHFKLCDSWRKVLIKWGSQWGFNSFKVNSWARTFKIIHPKLDWSSRRSTEPDSCLSNRIFYNFQLASNPSKARLVDGCRVMTSTGRWGCAFE